MEKIIFGTHNQQTINHLMEIAILRQSYQLGFRPAGLRNYVRGFDFCRFTTSLPECRASELQPLA